MKRHLNLLKITISLALILVLAISSFQSAPVLAAKDRSSMSFMPGVVYWWADAGKAALTGGVSGGVGGAATCLLGTPGVIAAAGVGALGGAVGGFLGYAVTSLLGKSVPVSEKEREKAEFEKIFDQILVNP